MTTVRNALFSLAALASFGTLPAGEIRISPTTLSPHQAVGKIRAARAAGDASPWTVRVAKGDYTFAEPLVFTPADHDIAFVGEEGAVFSGGAALGPWTDEGDGVWSTPAPRDRDGKLVFFESLYVNGRRATRASLLNPDRIFCLSNWVETAVAGPDGVTNYYETCWIKEPEIAALAKLSKEELAAAKFNVHVKWSYGSYPIESFDARTNTVTVRVGEPVRAWKRWHGEWQPNYFHVVNVRAGLDAPGEWCYDVKAAKVLYRPLDGERLDAFRAVAPVSRLVSVVRFEGDVEKGAFVRNVSFERIGFSETRAAGEVNGLGAVRIDQLQAASTAGAAVFGVGVHNATFRNCRFFNTENYAVRLEDGCVSNRFLSCEVVDAGAGGFWLGNGKGNLLQSRDPAHVGIGDPWNNPFRTVPETNTTFSATAFNVIDDCLVAHCGRFNPEGVGIVITHASDTKVTHNEITDLYYSGVSVGWTWGYYGSYAQRNEISFNRITNIGQHKMADMGGVYTLGASFGTVVTNNVIMDVDSISYGGWGLYNDEGSEGVLWENNLVANTSTDSYHIHFGRDNTLRNNILANGGNSRLAVSRPEGHHQVTFDRNIVYWQGGTAFNGWNRIADGTAKATWTNNVFWAANGVTELNGPVSGIVADPLFVDPAAGDWRLKPESPAIKFGFKPFDASLAGRRK